MKLSRNEIRVAIFIIVPIIIILLFVVLKLGYSLASTTVDVYLKVDNIKSIKKGTLVKVKGYEIGRIIEIKPVYKPSLHFLALMRIKRDVEVFEDCSAVIQNQNIIGEPEIEIRNPEKRGELISKSSVIEGIEYVNLESILQDAHVLLTSVSNTVDVFKGISLDSKSNLKVLITNLASSVTTLSQILNDSQKDIGATLSSFRKTASTLDEISQELKKHPVNFLFKGKKDDEK
jgi:ABC-type transporter Mla subunit MlaD